MPPHLMIEKVSILKNSNSLANDIYDWDIWFYNLHRYYNDYNLDVAKISIIGTNIDRDDQLIMKLKESISPMEILAKNSTSMTLSFIVKDEYKFSLIKQLHAICNLD